MMATPRKTLPKNLQTPVFLNLFLTAPPGHAAAAPGASQPT